MKWDRALRRICPRDEEEGKGGPAWTGLSSRQGQGERKREVINVYSSHPLAEREERERQPCML